MLLMFEKITQGRITQAMKRYSKAIMKDQYDPNKNSIHLQYLDANNF